MKMLETRGGIDIHIKKVYIMLKLHNIPMLNTHLPYTFAKGRQAQQSHLYCSFPPSYTVVVFPDGPFIYSSVIIIGYKPP